MSLGKESVEMDKKDTKNRYKIAFSLESSAIKKRVNAWGGVTSRKPQKELKVIKELPIIK